MTARVIGRRAILQASHSVFLQSGTTAGMLTIHVERSAGGDTPVTPLLPLKPPEQGSARLWTVYVYWHLRGKCRGVYVYGPVDG